MEKRELGKTGEYLSMIGFGGILVMDEDPASASRLVAHAIDRDINYFDVAPSYGNAEERLGPALEPYRKKVFLACKTEERFADGATAELHRSLKTLRTEYFDLYQLHAVTTLEQVDQILGPGGALEAFVQARQQGKVRYLGFSAHTEEAAEALLQGFQFDSMLFPVNWVCWHQGGFGPRALARAESSGVGLLALKALAKRRWKEGEERGWTKAWYAPVETYDEASLAVRFTLSRPVTAAVSPGHLELFDWACRAAEEFVPLSVQEEDLLAQRSRGLDPIFPE